MNMLKKCLYQLKHVGPIRRLHVFLVILPHYEGDFANGLRNSHLDVLYPTTSHGLARYGSQSSSNDCLSYEVQYSRL